MDPDPTGKMSADPDADTKHCKNSHKNVDSDIDYTYTVLFRYGNVKKVSMMGVRFFISVILK